MEGEEGKRLRLLVWEGCNGWWLCGFESGGAGEG